MPLIPFLTTWALGWLAYRAVQRQHAELSPVSIATAWALGVGVVHAIYYVHLLLLLRNPHPLLLILPGLAGLIDALRVARAGGWRGWEPFRAAPRASALLVACIGIMALLTAFNGLYVDTQRIWLGRAEAFDQLPDYRHSLEHIYWLFHPEYPPLWSHQYQWQMQFGESMLALKLPSLGYYAALLAAVVALLARSTQRPVLWAVIVALPGLFVWVWPTGTADMPLGASVTLGVCWLFIYRDSRASRDLWCAALVIGLLTLIKNEGMLLVACLLAALALDLLRPLRRWLALRSLLTVGGVSAVCALSWLLVVWSVAPGYSDFSLSAFSTEQLQTALSVGMPILVDPLLLAGAWPLLIVLLALGFWREPLLWLPPLLYALGMLFAYAFSVYPPGQMHHIVQSYHRLLGQMLPLALIYIIGALTSGQSVYPYFRRYDELTEPQLADALSADEPHPYH